MEKLRLSIFSFYLSILEKSNAGERFSSNLHRMFRRKILQGERREEESRNFAKVPIYYQKHTIP